MKRSTKIVLAAGLVAAVGALGVAGFAGSSYAEKWRDGHRYHAMFGGEYGKHHGGQRRAMRMFQSFDADDDGRLTQEEIDRGRSERFTRFDGNGDGRLDLQEFEALWLDGMRERMVDRFQNLDADGDAVVTAEEFSEPFARMVRFMDRNGDGVLSIEDRGRRGPGRWDDDDDDDDSRDN